MIYIANARIPTEKAHGLQIFKTIESLAALGAQIELIIPRRRNPIKTDPFEYYDVKKNFKITRIPAIDLVGIVPKLGFWIESLSFAKLTGIYLLFKKADVIYSRDEVSLWFLSFFKDNLYWESHHGQNSFFVKRILKKCRGIIVISKGLKDFYISKGVPEEKILVAPDSVDLDLFDIQYSKFDIRKEMGLPQDKKIVMYTGHLYDWKGADVLLEAARQYDPPPHEEGLGEVIESVDTMTPLTSPLMRGEKEGGLAPHEGEKKAELMFVFVGGTEGDIKKFKEKARDLNNIMILGHKPHSEIPKYLAAADVLVLPNSAKSEISRRYTSPMKLFEYMAAGRPIVASDMPSIREILNEENAVLFEPDDSVSLSGAIQKILKDGRLADKLASRAKQDAARFTWQERSGKILSFIGRRHH